MKRDTEKMLVNAAGAIFVAIVPWITAIINEKLDDEQNEEDCQEI